MDLKVSSKSQFRVLRELIFISAFYFCCMIFFYLKVEFGLFKVVFLSTFVFYFIGFFLPVYVLHANYLKNKYNLLKIEENRAEINGCIATGNDIEKVKIFATYQHFDGLVGGTALPYNDYYYYVELHLKEGKIIRLTSLLDYKLDKILQKHFKDVAFIDVVTPFPLIPNNKYQK